MLWEYPEVHPLQTYDMVDFLSPRMRFLLRPNTRSMPTIFNLKLQQINLESSGTQTSVTSATTVTAPAGTKQCLAMFMCVCVLGTVLGFVVAIGQSGN